MPHGSSSKGQITVTACPINWRALIHLSLPAMLAQPLSSLNYDHEGQNFSGIKERTDEQDMEDSYPFMSAGTH